MFDDEVSGRVMARVQAVLGSLGMAPEVLGQSVYASGRALCRLCLAWSAGANA